MNQTLLVKLAPTPDQHAPDQHAALLRTLEGFNAACNAMAVVAFAGRCANKLGLQERVYYDIREQFGLAAQMTIGAMSKGSAADKGDQSIQPTFRPHGAMVYDERSWSLRFPRVDRVALLTLGGRLEVPFRFGQYADGMRQRPRGQADLLDRPASETVFLLGGERGCARAYTRGRERVLGRGRGRDHLGGDVGW